jgi:hypothetical protein
LLPYIEQLTAQLAKSSVKQHWAGSNQALTGIPLAQSNVHRMIRRRVVPAESKDTNWKSYVPGGECHPIPEQQRRRELAQQMAAHESPRTTALDDRRDDEVAIDEVERIVL